MEEVHSKANTVYLVHRSQAQKGGVLGRVAA
jgi:hypothetical protein